MERVDGHGFDYLAGVERRFVGGVVQCAVGGHAVGVGELGIGVAGDEVVDLGAGECGGECGYRGIAGVVDDDARGGVEVVGLDSYGLDGGAGGSVEGSAVAGAGSGGSAAVGGVVDG